MRWEVIQTRLAIDAYDDLYSPGWRTGKSPGKTTGRVSVAEPLIQTFPPLSAPRGGITFFRPDGIRS